MRLWFLGDAEKDGAPCTLPEVAAHRITIDTGVRMQGGDRSASAGKLSRTPARALAAPRQGLRGIPGGRQARKA